MSSTNLVPAIDGRSTLRRRISELPTKAAEFGNKYQGLATVLGIGFLVYQLLQVNQSNSQAAMAAVYAEQNELSRFLAEEENMAIRAHFYKDDAGEHLQKHQQKLRERLKNESPETLAKLMMVAEITANCSECVYQLRSSLPKDDWNAWWASFQDTYDESPVLQQYHDRRATWYGLDDHLRIKDPIARNRSLVRYFSYIW